jgi:hypothetical protein
MVASFVLFFLSELIGTYPEAGWPVLKSRAYRHNAEVVNSAMDGLKSMDLPELWLPIETGSR